MKRIIYVMMAVLSFVTGGAVTGAVVSGSSVNVVQAQAGSSAGSLHGQVYGLESLAGIHNCVNTEWDMYAACDFADCTQTGEHTHSYCGIEGCTLTEAHEHGACGYEGCMQTGEHTHNYCGIEGCTLTEAHSHRESAHDHQSGNHGHHH